MSRHQPTRPPADGPSVPSLQIGPSLQAAGEAKGASLGFLPGISFRAVLAALALALAVTAAIVALTHGSRVANHPAPAAERALAGTPPRQRSRPVPIAPKVARHASAPTSPPPPAAVSYAHDLTLSDLTSMVAAGTGYTPPAYLADVYREVAGRYRIPWRLLAAVEYIQGGYVNALAGPAAAPEQALAKTVGVGGQRAVNPHVLALAVAAAWQPSRALLADAGQLAADGAVQNPAQAVSAYMHGSQASTQVALTLAQEIGGSTLTSSATPLAKLAAMRNEAQLLNGLPYTWGGGHANSAWVVSSGYDCSGFVSAVLHTAGFLGSPQTTQTLPGTAGILNGPGKYVSIYDRTIATVKVWVKARKIVTVRKAVNPTTIGVHVVKGRTPDLANSVSIKLPKWVGEWRTLKITKLVPSIDNTNNNEHVIIDLNGHWWESGGSTADGGAAMVHPLTDPSPGYLKTFNKILHPSGL